MYDDGRDLVDDALPSHSPFNPHSEIRHAYQAMDKHTFLRELIRCHKELELAQSQFDHVSDPLLIDHVVFRVGAAERRLNFLFALARELNIAFDGAQWEWCEEHNERILTFRR